MQIIMRINQRIPFQFNLTLNALLPRVLSPLVVFSLASAKGGKVGLRQALRCVDVC